MSTSVTGGDSLKRKFAALSDVVRGRAQERALIAGALIIQNDAKRRAAKDTGNMARSIHIGGHEDLAHDRQGIVRATGQPVPPPESSGAESAVYIGTDVEYAPNVEFGTGRRRAQPFLRPAIDENGPAVRNEVGAAYVDLIRAAIR